MSLWRENLARKAQKSSEAIKGRVKFARNFINFTALLGKSRPRNVQISM